MEDVHDPSDAVVIAQSSREPGRFGVIFDRHFEAVHALLSRRLGRDAADELASEVFVVAFERRGRFDVAAASARPWLYGIAVNVGRRHARTTRSRAELHRRAAASVVDDRPIGEALERAEERERLREDVPRAIGALPARDRDALLLHCWEGLSYEDVAIALGVPLGTVRSRINRARRLLRDALFVTSEGGPNA